MPFSQQIPKPISDKISNYLESNKEKDGKNGKNNGRNGQGIANKHKGSYDKNKAEVIYNSDKSQLHWRLKDGENFTKVFCNRQRDCPKMPDGNIICMKFLIRGLCIFALSSSAKFTLAKTDVEELRDQTPIPSIKDSGPDILLSQCKDELKIMDDSTISQLTPSRELTGLIASSHHSPSTPTMADNNKGTYIC